MVFGLMRPSASMPKVTRNAGTNRFEFLVIRIGSNTPPRFKLGKIFLVRTRCGCQPYAALVQLPFSRGFFTIRTMAQNILLLCKDKNTKILAILAEQNAEEITEFQTTVQMVQVVVNRLLSGKRQVVLDVAILDRIYVILGEYEDILEQYVQTGRLRRLLGSNRLRRRLEKINSDLHVQLKLFVDSLKKLNTPQDPKGNLFL